jgi:hypothetical protein
MGWEELKVKVYVATVARQGWYGAKPEVDTITIF